MKEIKKGALAPVKKFSPGQVYMVSDWFTGGMSKMTVSHVEDGKVTFKTVLHEVDGDFERDETYNLLSDKAGNESILLFTYHGHECRIWAEEVAS